ncbi:MAG: hypothetical protein DHS20C14_00380 [Phycisphaeraceae bacterium]|nr:MAG: hypothetical protein DHS20C14_00380 [Phycisphaeraceae bacterium]
MHRTNRLSHRVTIWGVPVAALALAFFACFTPGCNTTEGLGKDIKAGGEALEDAADDAN